VPKQFFLDFDGTLIDPRARLYKLFCQLVPECRLSFDEYWALKRTAITQAELLQRYHGYDEQKCSAVKARWMTAVEDEAALLTDTPLPGVSEWLGRMADRNELILVTARQSSDLVEQQLIALGWRDFFKHVLVTGQKTSKVALMQPVCSAGQPGVIIGDTGEDIRAGKELGLETVAVTSGMLSADVLKKYEPDRILTSITDY
jgi:phosphoglycolate phosphatase